VGGSQSRSGSYGEEKNSNEAFHLVALLSLYNIGLKLIKFVEQSPSWEENSRSDYEECTYLLWKQKVDYGVHKIQPINFFPEADEFSPHPESLYF
jgi:hypothetical protein